MMDKKNKSPDNRKRDKLDKESNDKKLYDNTSNANAGDTVKTKAHKRNNKYKNFL